MQAGTVIGGAMLGLALLALGVAAPQAKAASAGYDYYLTGNAANTVTTTQPGLLLAGDYVASEYPGTLETSIRQGLAAARHITG